MSGPSASELAAVPGQAQWLWEPPVVVTGFGGCLERSLPPSEAVARYLESAPPGERKRGERSVGGRSLGLALARTLAHPHMGRLPGAESRAIVVGTDVAALEETVKFHEEIEAVGPRLVNPALFPVTVMNAAAGLAAIDHQCQGPNLTLNGGARSALDAIAYGADLVSTGAAEVSFSGGFEGRGPGACRARRRGEEPTNLAVLLALGSLERAREGGARATARVLAYLQSDSRESVDPGAVLEVALQAARTMAPDAVDQPARPRMPAGRSEEALLALLEAVLCASTATAPVLVPVWVQDDGSASPSVLVLASFREERP